MFIVRIFIFLAFFGSSIFRIEAQNINVALFSEYKITAFSFTVLTGKYEVVANEKVIMRLDANQIASLKVKGERVRIETASDGNEGTYKFLQIRGIKQGNIFSLQPTEPSKNARQYEDDLFIRVENGFLKIINDVDFERYIAGVVESEGGYSAPQEYYKTQAILCRTYAMKYIEKHIAEGFNLCDDVHCQAYKSRCRYNLNILKATEATAGLVIVDSNLNLISATFFSNSGGETVNSEDVWGGKVSYLRGVTDTFCIGQPCFTWQRIIKKSDWLTYLYTKGADSICDSADFTYLQSRREKFYQFQDIVLPLKQVRQDWQLRSTYFSIEPQGNFLVFNGKGYGHAVGLAQEGAMQMSKLGHNYESIINHYYSNVRIMSIKALNFFKVDPDH